MIIVMIRSRRMIMIVIIKFREDVDVKYIKKNLKKIISKTKKIKINFIISF